jgi:hypothetical protein
MTIQAENELLTHVGPGMPVGAPMRQYWLPAGQARHPEMLRAAE